MEWFGAVAGVREAIPAADLDEEFVATMSEAQWDAINSPTGKRLYRHTDPSTSDSETTRAQAKAANAGATSEPS